MIGRTNVSTAAAFRRFVRNDEGAAAVEFAMVAFPFFFVLGCIIETGLMLFTEYVLQTGVEEAARELRTGQAQSAGMDAGDVKGIVCETAGVVIDCAGMVHTYINAETTFAALKASLPSMMSVGPPIGGIAGPIKFDCGNASEAVSVVATYDWKFTLPLMSLFANTSMTDTRRLVGFAMFKNEPFPTGTSCT